MLFFVELLNVSMENAVCFCSKRVVSFVRRLILERNIFLNCVNLIQRNVHVSLLTKGRNHIKKENEPRGKIMDAILNTHACYTYIFDILLLT